MRPIDRFKGVSWLVLFCYLLPPVGITYVLVMLGLRLFQNYQRDHPRTVPSPQWDAYLVKFKAENGY